MFTITPKGHSLPPPFSEAQSEPLRIPPEPRWHPSYTLSQNTNVSWLSGNTLASINVVALRQTRLVLGWVTVCGRVNHLAM